MPALPALPQLVPSFIIDPVLRQARRFSRGSFASESSPAPQPQDAEGPGPSPPAPEDALAAEAVDVSRVVNILLTVSEPATTLSDSSFLAAAPPLPTPTPQLPSPLLAPRASRRDGSSAATVDTPLASDMASVELNAEHDPIPRSRESSSGELGHVGILSDEDSRPPQELPEDDGMGALRGRILDVQSQEIPTSEKALLMHLLLTENYAKTQFAQTAEARHGADPGSSPTVFEQPLVSRPLESLKFWQLSLGEPSTPKRFLLTEDDLKPTYAPPGADGQGVADEPRPLGCEHYRRNVKLQCATCQKWYTCRLCHDDVEDHALPRKETKNMLCMRCGYAQKASDECVKCGALAARYYCAICKLWNDHPDRSNYHCHDCGICRVGAGLGKDFFHCKTLMYERQPADFQSCGICITIETKDTHRCREGAMDCNCPICGEYMFTSTKHMIHMNPCRHIIHKRCYDQHMLTSYKCPICNKSARNMESLFRKWDKNVEEQPMPPEWRDARAIIYCNDCEAKSQTLYHWVGLKCSICKGYNTREVQILNAPSSSPFRPGPEALQALANSAASPAPDVEPALQHSSAAEPDTVADLDMVASAISGSSSTARDIAQPRRTIGHVPGASVGSHEDVLTSLPVYPRERFARSLSPTPLFVTPDADGPGERAPGEECDEGADDDFLGVGVTDFWARVGLGGVMSGEDDSEEDENGDGDGATSNGESSSDSEAGDDEDEDDEISLFGHR